MAYFFEKIKTKTLSGQDQTLEFNSDNPPSFSIGATNYGTIATTGSFGGNNVELTFNRPIKLNQPINNLFISSANSSSITINRSLLVTGSGPFNINNLSTNSRTLATYANLVVGGANAPGQIAITSDSSVARTLTLSGNLTVGTGSGSGTVTIASDTSSARVFTLGRSLTIEAGSLNTIAYNTSTTSLGAVPGPTVNGEYNLVQKRISGANQTPEWVSREPRIEYTGVRGLEATTVQTNSAITMKDDYSKLMFKYLRNGQRVRSFAGPSGVPSFTRRFTGPTGGGWWQIANINYANFTFQVQDFVSGNFLNAAASADWGFDVETNGEDEYNYTFGNFKKITVILKRFLNETGNNWKFRRLQDESSPAHVYYRVDQDLNKMRDFFFHNAFFDVKTVFMHRIGAAANPVSVAVTPNSDFTAVTCKNNAGSIALQIIEEY